MLNRKEQLKKVHQELQVKNAEYFESLLAYSVIKQQSVLSAIQLMSSIILKALVDNREKLISELLADKKIRTELYDSRMFGQLKECQEYLLLDSKEIYLDLVSCLQDPSIDLAKIMQVHCVCLYRILPASGTAIEHGRLESGATAMMTTTQFGICRHSFFKAKLNKLELKAHVAALHRFVPDDSANSQKMQDYALPFVAGMSGHTQTLIRGAIRLGLTSEEGLKEYAIAAFAFLTAGGNHSFHEVAQVVANLTGIPYRPGYYRDLLPASFQQTNDYVALKEDFHHFKL